MEAVASSIAEAMLSSMFDYIFERLFASSEFLKFARQDRVLSQLNKWEKLLPKIKAFLDDAEDKQMVSRQVKLWLNELRDIVYDAEDIIEEIATKALCRRILGETRVTGTGSKVCRFFPNCFTGLSLSGVKFSARMSPKIEDITIRFEDMVAKKNLLNLLERSGEGRLEKVREGLRSTSSLVDESQVYGREMDKDVIIQLLMNVEIGEIGVLCIVGMGGVGKTTLAQLVYEKVENLFELRVWACVSEDFDVVRVTRILLQAVTMEGCYSEDLNLLQLKLREKLSGKKFLIVLDDVWNENYERWDVLRRPFMAGAAGSRVLVTTRSERVASIMTTCGVYHLQALSDDACLSLFARHALAASNFDGHSILKGIGEEIVVKKCKGLPLAAKTLGGLLRGKVNSDEWKDMLRSKIWDIPEERGGIIPALKLSYHHLPSHLKRCFAYCAIFPKDYEFDKNELVLLWMAEGLIEQATQEKQVWNKGLAYFHDLLSRSFFQRSNSNKTLFVMHDLINDLAQNVAGEICFHFEDNYGDKLPECIEKLRHLSFTRCQYDIFKRFGVFEPAKSLRTFIALPIDGSSWAACCYMSKVVLQELVAELRYLRVLCLSGYRIDKLPYSIGHLEHLRYLNLSYTTIKQLPESVGSLFNLQTLLLRGCKELTKLPQGIENLINLLVLDLTDTEKLVEMPLRIGNLESLEILSKFIVGKDNQFGIKELKDLMHLKGDFCIMGLENVVDAQDARHANLTDKQHLDALDLKWSDLDYQNEENEMHVLEVLEPNKNLKELRISCYGGTRFPLWLEDPSFTNVVEVKLHNCSRSMSLPSLGRLPSLKAVSIQGMNRVKEVGFEFYEDDLLSTKWFPSLEVLCFQNMLEWERWSSPKEADVNLGGGFPSLRELVIQDCPKLIGNLPSCLPALVKLIISNCPKLGGSLISLPSLCELKIEDCNKVQLENIVNLTSLTTLRIKGIRDLSYLPQEMLKSLGALQILKVSNCTELTYLWQKGNGMKNIASLEHLKIKGCSKFVSLVVNEQGLPCSLEDMELMNCGNLKKPSLKSLQIESCPKLLYFPETGCLSTLRHIKLKDCAALITLPDWTLMLNCKTTEYLLQDLQIEECPSLTSFPRGILPTRLQRLKIRGCKDLRSLPEGIMQNDNSTNMSHLESLEIDACPSLTCFPEGILPFSLKTLKISECSKLEPLSEQHLHNNASLEYIGMWDYASLRYLPECLHCLAHLTELIISSCPALIAFPETGLPPTLRTLEIYSCVNLKSLPERMQNLASLQYLTVCDCPCLVTFPKGGLPPQLLLFEVWDCINLKEPMSEWNLDSLISLKELIIAGAPDIASFPDENCLLPTSLTLIFIARLNNLVSLSSGLKNLTSLEALEVVDCPKLRHLPREGLPATLGRLCIKNCKHLKRQCLKKNGAYSPRIAHIPYVEIEW